MTSASRATVGKGVIWTLVESGSTQLLAAAVFFVIARYVTPAEFGVVVGAILVIDFFRGVFVEAAATALMAKSDPQDVDYNACFFIILGMGGAFAALVFIGADFIASHVPLPGLREALPAVSFLLIATGLSRTHEVWLSRHLQFRPLTLRSIASVGLGGIAGAVLAVLGYGLWALVVQQLVASTVAAVSLWLLTGWRPSLKLTRESVTSLLRYSRHVLLMNLTNFVHGQTDTAATTYFLGSVHAGLYAAAKRIGLVLNGVLSAPLGRVAMPALASIQHDGPRMRRAYLQAIALTASVTAPAFAGIAALSGDLVHILLGPNWQAAAGLVTALAANYFMITVGQYNFSVLLVKGKAAWLSLVTAVYAVVSLVVLLAVVNQGMMVLAIAVSARTVLLSPLSTAPTLRLLELKWRDYFGALLPPVCCALAMAGALELLAPALQGISPLARLTVLIPCGALVYAALLLLFNPAAIQELRSMLLVSVARRK